MPLFWELFGFRSWDADEVDNVDVATLAFMTDVCKKVAKDRKPKKG